MSPEIIIRRMEAADAEKVSSLEKIIFSQPWSCQGFLDALAGETIFLVAEREGRLLGYCGMYCSLDEGEITNVAVSPDCRAKGIGKMLVERLLLESRASGIHHVVLEVRISNVPAIRLYEHLGFAIQGIRKGFYEKPREDGYVMGLSQ